MRKFLVIILALVLLISALALVLSAANKWGDITSDGSFNINDAVKLSQYLAGWSITLSPDERKAADVYYDTFVDTKDAVKMAQYLAGWNVILGNGNPMPDGATQADRDIEIEAEDLIDALIIYPEFPEQIGRNYDYDVSVTVGSRTEKLPVYNHTLEYNCARRPGMDMYRRFSSFAFDGVSVRVDIKVKTDFKSYTVFPSAKKFENYFNSQTGVISVYLDKPDYFGVMLDDNQNSIISVFADYPETGDQLPTQEEINSGKVIRVTGWYEVDKNHPYVAKATASGVSKIVPGVLEITTEGTVIYIAPGAVLNARVRISADNCRVIGRGAIVDPFENIYEKDIRDAGTEGTSYKLLGFRAKNGIADGPILLDARCYNVQLDGSYNKVYNIKALSSMMTTDGITMAGSGYHTAEHCWFYVGDNGIVSSGKNIVARDIAIGTTCAAIFPQGSPTNELFEDIYVFRADDGIITNRYNPNGSQISVSITFRRLSAVELPAMTSPYKSGGSMHLFQGANTGTQKLKTIILEDVTANGIDPTQILYMRNNGSSDIATNNYTVTIRNLYVNGSAIANKSSLTIKDTTAGNTFNVTSDSYYSPVTRNQTVVNYTAPGKVYIGSKLLAFDTAPIVSGSNFSLPADEICTYLRRNNSFTKDYVTVSDLVSAGHITASQVKNGNLYLTPAYSGQNLLIADRGEISYFAEHSCYQVDLVTASDANGVYYNIYPFDKSQSLSAGMSRYISDEIKMYGTGTYTLTFKAKANKTGNIRVVLYKDGTSASTTISLNTSWKNCTATFTIDSAALSAYRCLFVIMGAGSNLSTDLLNPISVRDFVLTKK